MSIPAAAVIVISRSCELALIALLTVMRSIRINKSCTITSNTVSLLSKGLCSHKSSCANYVYQLLFVYEGVF